MTHPASSGRLLCRALAVVLALEQILFAAPVSAAIEVRGGKPVDAAAISQLQGAQLRPQPTPDLFRGDAALSIPVLVPPGTGGSTPGLQISYKATTTDGWLGVGWNLSLDFPLVIQRSTRRGPPEYDASDGFELAGQRLIETAEAERYVTEQFDHSRIDHVSIGGDFWRVLRPDGTRLYYGFDTTAASVVHSEEVRSVAPIAADCPLADAGCTTKSLIIPAGIPFAWHLDRIEDRQGNVIPLFPHLSQTISPPGHPGGGSVRGSRTRRARCPGGRG